MAHRRVLAIIQAGGAGSRMDVLTRERAKPALPFAGAFHLVDFPLSNLSHSGIEHVWLSVQFQGATLEEEVANGRPWELDRTRGGLRILMPQEGTGSLDEDGFSRGNADQLFRIRDQIESLRPDVVVVASADHVYRFDFSELVDRHLDTGAECTVVTSTVPLHEASDHATVEDDDGVVVGFASKPEHPSTDVVATEIFAYDPAVLLVALDELHRELGPRSAGGDTGLGDFGDHLVPWFVARGGARTLEMAGYWRDVGQPHLYLRAHLDMLTDDHDVLDVEDWPILTRQPQRTPARVLAGSEVVDSLVSPGCRVAGRVVRSVLGPGVEVAHGAQVVDSVVFDDTTIEQGASVTASIVDSGCTIGADASVGGPDADLDDSAAITLLGRDCVVPAGASVGIGGRLEPGSTA